MQNTSKIFLILYLLNLLNFIAKQHIPVCFASQEPILFTAGLGVVAYAVGSSRKFAPWNQTGAKLQTTAFIISSAAFIALKESKTLSSSSDRLYYLTSALLIGSAGFLSKLDGKVNILMTALFICGQYGINRLSPSTKPSSNSLDREGRKGEFGKAEGHRKYSYEADRSRERKKGESSSVQVFRDRGDIKQRIISTQIYVESIQDYESTTPSPEFISLFTHVHQILPGLYLGDYRAFLSVDPKFVVRYPMADEVQEIGAGYNNTALMRNVMPCLDMKGCSELGIGLVVSVTQFKPAPAVQEEDWSLFQPNLAGIKRLQVSVDDTESTWELLEPELDRIFDVIDQARQEDKPVLIHCVKGACRSAAVMIAYLMNRYDVTYDQAHNFVKSIRHQVDMKPSWIGSAQEERGLLGYQAKLSSKVDL